MISADTNIFGYLYQSDAPLKQATARTIVSALAEAQAPVGLQVVGELQNVIRRKFRRGPLEAAEAGRWLLAAFEIFPPSVAAASEALAQLAASRMSYWDALLVFSCSQAGVTAFLSEDLQDGARYAGVQIINPFTPEGRLSPSAQQLLGL